MEQKVQVLVKCLLLHPIMTFRELFLLIKVSLEVREVIKKITKTLRGLIPHNTLSIVSFAPGSLQAVYGCTGYINPYLIHSKRQTKMEALMSNIATRLFTHLLFGS